jgi:hypothetical protein
MAHPEITNKTPFVFDPLFLADEEGRSLFVPIVKGTFHIRSSFPPVIAKKQLPVNPIGEPRGDPARSSYKYEPETAFVKPTTDIVLIGHAYPSAESKTEVNVTLRVGELEKIVRVVGDRTWIKSLGMVIKDNPKPLEPIPLIYERAFGGWDAAEPDPVNGRFEPRNPVGVGFPRKKFEEGLPLPNLEDPKRPLKSYGDTPPPAGFGFLSPNWQPRVKLAGTYDKAWQQTRSPLLPTDFDRRFFNAASPGLIAPEYLKGNERVTIENATPEGRMVFSLPSVQPAQIRVQLRGKEDAILTTNLDTVIINTDENLLVLLWRANLVVRNGPHDVAAIEVTAEGLPPIVT